MITIDGRTDTIAAHALALGVPPSTLRNRAAALGGDYQRAADETRRRFGEWKRGPRRGSTMPGATRVAIGGESLTVAAWAARCGVPRRTLDQRKWANGWTWEQTIAASLARPGAWPKVNRCAHERKAAA